MTVSTVDWALLAVLLFSMLLGAWRGLVYEVLSLLGWVASFYLAQWWAPAVAQWLPWQTSSETLRHAVAFSLVFICVLFSAGLLAFGLKKLTAAIGLRPIDRSLGALFGLIRGAVILLAATVVVQMTALHTQPEWTQSQGGPLLGQALQALKPVLPQQFGHYL